MTELIPAKLPEPKVVKILKKGGFIAAFSIFMGLGMVWMDNSLPISTFQSENQQIYYQSPSNVNDQDLRVNLFLKKVKSDSVNSSLILYYNGSDLPVSAIDVQLDLPKNVYILNIKPLSSQLKIKTNYENDHVNLLIYTDSDNYFPKNINDLVKIKLFNNQSSDYISISKKHTQIISADVNGNILGNVNKVFMK